ncbi:MAG: hypothetical protein U1E50_15340 [Caulobacteraceae bacterium]
MCSQSSFNQSLVACAATLVFTLSACDRSAPPAADPASPAKAVPAPQQPASRPAASAPPSEWIETGACPFEGCQYGRWTATKAVTLYDRPGGAALPARLAKGDVVTAEGGEVRATPVRAVVAKAGPEDVARGLTEGSVVYALYPLGEGAVMVWKDGKTIDTSLDVELRFDPALPETGLPYVWWAKVKRADGSTAWVRDASADFSGTDQFE